MELGEGEAQMGGWFGFLAWGAWGGGEGGGSGGDRLGGRARLMRKGAVMGWRGRGRDFAYCRDVGFGRQALRVRFTDVDGCHLWEVLARG